MLRVEEMRARLAAKVPEVAGNLGTAGEFAQLVERNQLPQWRIGAFVLPGALTGGLVRSASTTFIQDIDETIAVVLIVRVAADPTGGKALDEITPLVRAVVMGVVGWGPEDAPGIFELVRGELVGSQGGALIFQIDFKLSDQLRNIP